MSDMSGLAAALADRYTIERELGQGGMATVYLAQDLKHNRKVAIKVLKPELAAVLGAERFVQEIATTAALQHPNILPLFDSGRTGGKADGRSDDFLYYVMPYVEGETLRQKLDRETQLGVDESVQVVREVADALQYAHDHGVVHRDIKPENILLHAGRPMVADFGIALAVSAAAGGRMTETGLSLGTPHYMSPEQATAERNITARSDIYSLGAVLYEMLTGEPPHTGTSAQQIIMRIVTEKPRSVSEARESVPPNVAAAVMTALQKLPADRFESAKAFAAALTNPSFHTTATVPAALASTALPPYRLTALLAITTLAFAALAAWGWLRPRNRGVEREAAEFYLDPPDTSTAFASFAISPDGRRLVADVMTGDGHALYQRTLDARDWRAIPGTEGAGNPNLPTGKKPVFPFFSPDGGWVGYASRDGTLKRIPVDGGTAQTITPVPRGFWGASWAADNTIVFSAPPSDTQPATLFRVPANGGVPERLTALDSMSGYHFFPSLSGDGAVLFFENPFPPTLMALSLGSGRVARLGTGISPLAARDGQLVYATLDGVIFSRTFNPRTLAFEGAPRRVAEGAEVIAGVIASYAVSPGGTLVYETGSVGSQLLLVDREGGTRAFGESFPVSHPRFSPSGDRVVFIRAGAGLSVAGGGDVWVYSFASGTAQLLSHEGPAADPAWSTDGRYVGYSAVGNGQGGWKLFRRLADGTGSAELLVSGKTDLWQMAFVPGNQEIVFLSAGDLFRFRIGRDSQPVPLFQTTAFEQHPTIAPDGHWLAYTSNETGTAEIYVRSYPDMGARTVVSVGGGSYPAWSASGSELFYWGHGHLVVAALRHEGGRLDIVGHTELFPTTPFQPEFNRNYDVRPDGREFVMVRGAGNRAVVRLGALNGVPQ